MVFGTRMPPRFMNTLLVNRLVEDPKYFLETFVNIVDKERITVPFIFNASQLKYYQQMSLRDIILKPRQLGFCLAPTTCILKGNLTWVPLKDIQIGDKIVAVDELTKKGNRARRMIKAVVKKKFSTFQCAHKLKTDKGMELIATKDHKLLSSFGGASFWRKVKNFRIGDHIRYVAKPWEYLKDSVYYQGRWKGKMLPNDGWARIVSIEELPKQEMIDLQTSEGTYIAEGFVSHNSTQIMGLFLHDTMYIPNTTSVIVAQTEKDASDLFARVRFMFESIDEEFRPKVRYSNRKELLFDKINSWYFVGSAEAKGFGRGKTINNLHCSEVSISTWNKDFMDGLLESVPKSGRVVVESTARGEGGLFYDMYFDAKNKDNEFRNHFYRWFEHWEYREPIPSGMTREDYVNSYDWEELELVKKYNLVPEQIQWRRIKKSRLRAKFVQEYPELDDVDAFIKSGSSIFDTIMLKERDDALPEQSPAEIWLGGELFLYRIVQPGAKYIISCDTSEGDITSDFSAAMVTKIWPLPLEQCALLHGRWTPDIFSEKIYKIARAYNYGLIAVERNNHGHAVLLNLGNGIVRQGAVVLPPYPNLYVGPDRKMGWHTTPLSKPQMIDELDRAMRSGELIINSKEFIKEARRFVAMKGGTMGVPTAVGNDDIVCAQAIGIVAVQGGKFDYTFE